MCWLILELHMDVGYGPPAAYPRRHVSGIDLQWVYLFLFVASGALQASPELF
jgi:hypothetical protein